MKVLIVDDQVDTVKDILSHCEENQWESRLSSFEEFDDILGAFDPDVVVLDWKDDANGEIEGEPIFEKIWATGFKPIIIFSAYADGITLDEKYKASNLIMLQPKGDEAPVIRYLDEICPYVPTINTLKDDFNKALIQALNSIGMMNATQPLSANVVRYVFAKRVSKYFDSECAEESPPPWIQYTYPVISRILCVCDIIRIIPKQRSINSFNIIGQPDEYRMILTPSCDIAQNKVSHVLCAKCYPKTDFHKYAPSATPSEKQLAAIIANLNAGYNNSLVSLPSIPNVLPHLTVDLKKVELLPLKDVAMHKGVISGHHEYFRVASIDSPFREQIVWAYMITSCRPGVPNRDMTLWAKELMRP
jgi:CTP synthase